METAPIVNVRFINLDRRSDRCSRFLASNNGVANFERISAADGKQLDRDELVRIGLISSDLDTYSTGALGAAFSHVSCWKDASQQESHVTIAEDDAVFNLHFSLQCQHILRLLPSNWDMILWGWNFDSILDTELPGGITRACQYFSSEFDESQVEQFRTANYAATPVRLLGAFGFVCYSISPSGAQKLLERCLPLRPELVDVPALGRQLYNIGIDTILNKHYRSIAAFASYPPLVITQNDKRQSDVECVTVCEPPPEATQTVGPS